MLTSPDRSPHTASVGLLLFACGVGVLAVLCVLVTANEWSGLGVLIGALLASAPRAVAVIRSQHAARWPQPLSAPSQPGLPVIIGLVLALALLGATFLLGQWMLSLRMEPDLDWAGRDKVLVAPTEAPDPNLLPDAESTEPVRVYLLKSYELSMKRIGAGQDAYQVQEFVELDGKRYRVGKSPPPVMQAAGLQRERASIRPLGRDSNSGDIMVTLEDGPILRQPYCVDKSDCPSGKVTLEGVKKGEFWDAQPREGTVNSGPWNVGIRKTDWRLPPGDLPEDVHVAVVLWPAHALRQYMDPFIGEEPTDGLLAIVVAGLIALAGAITWDKVIQSQCIWLWHTIRRRWFPQTQRPAPPTDAISV